jgi:hypothetical protein
VSVPQTGARPSPPARRESVGRWILVSLPILFVVLSTPVLVRGAPLADDFAKCLEPQRIGLLPAFGSSFERLGAIRPAHILEILVTTEVCQHLPFGFAIAVPLALTLLVAMLLRGLLRDMDVPSPWPEIGAALWLLQPLGTESALWPAALHVPLGLTLAVSAVRLHRAGRFGWGTLSAVGAFLSLEQVLLALPLAVWFVTPSGRRRRALAATIPVAVAALVAFLLWPGQDPRLQATLLQRFTSLAEDPAFYLQFPAVGLGLHSIPLAVMWAVPLGVVILAIGALLGARLGPRILRGAEAGTDRSFVQAALLASLGLILLVNVPVVLSVPRQGSPRLFAPTWLVLSATVAVVGPRISFKRQATVGAVAGLLAAGAVLSLALSVDVRLRSAEFTEISSQTLALQVQDGEEIAICGVRRTVVEPAPRGAFAVHEFVYDWAAADALEYYTGRRATFVLAGELWERPCPDSASVDRLVSFSELLRGARK